MGKKIKNMGGWVGAREKETGAERAPNKIYAILSSLFLHWLY